MTSDFDRAGFCRLAEGVRKRDRRRQHLTDDRAGERERVEELEGHQRDATEARVLLQQVARLTQRQLEDRINSLVSMAQAAVFPDDPYEFKLEFVERRNKTECDVWFRRGGALVNPMDCSGGGPKDVAAFAARLAFWSLEKRHRPVVVLDEPFKFLHGAEAQRNVSDLLRTLSERLGMQILVVSDQGGVTGDRVFRIDEMTGEGEQ